MIIIRIQLKSGECVEIFGLSNIKLFYPTFTYEQNPDAWSSKSFITWAVGYRGSIILFIWR